MLDNSRVLQEFKHYLSYVANPNMLYFSTHPFYDNTNSFNRLIDSLNVEVTTNEFIASVYLYSEKYDYMMTISEGGNDLIRNISDNAESWLNSYKDGDFFRVIYREGARGERIFSYIIPIVNNKENSTIALILNIPFNRLIERTDSLTASEDSSIFILSGDQVIPIVDNSSLSSDDFNMLKNMDNSVQLEIDTETLIVDKVYDPEMHIGYMSVITQNVLIRNVAYISKTYYIITMSFCLLFIVMAWFYTRFMYRPMEQLLRVVSQESSKGIDSIQLTEFQYFLSKYKSLVETNNEIEAKLKANRIILKERFLTRLLKGYFSESLDNKEFLIKLQGNSYQVILIYHTYTADNTVREWETWQCQLQLIKDAVIESFNNNNFQGDVCPLENGEIVIIVAKHQNAQCAMETFIENMLNQVDDIMVDKRSYVSISKEVNQLNKIHIVYKQAQQAIRLGMLSKESRIHYCHDFEVEVSYKINYETIVRQFVIMLKDYDDTKLDTFIKMIMDKVQSELKNHYQMQTYYIKVMTKIMEYIESTTNLHFQINLSRFCSKIVMCRVNTEVYNALKQELTDISDAWNKIKDNINKVDKNVSRTISYIQQNYHKSIGLEQVADQVGLNACYISRIFKKSTNESFGDYLARFRIVKACKLLVETDIPVYNVGEKVGFGSTFSFNRTFKKVKGCSAKQYRDNCKSI